MFRVAGIEDSSSVTVAIDPNRSFVTLSVVDKYGNWLNLSEVGLRSLADVLVLAANELHEREAK